MIVDMKKIRNDLNLSVVNSVTERGYTVEQLNYVDKKYDLDFFTDIIVLSCNLNSDDKFTYDDLFKACKKTLLSLVIALLECEFGFTTVIVVDMYKGGVK